MSPLALGWVFLRIGATAFGGIGAALALIERELVHTRHALTDADLTESLTYTKLLPGSTVVQVVSYLGYRLAGWRGSAVATVAFVLPSAVGMLALTAVYGAATALPAVGPAVSGLTAAVVGVLLATAYRLGKANVKEPVTLALAFAAFVAGAMFAVNAALVVVVAGLIGIAVFAVPPKTGQPRQEAPR